MNNELFRDLGIDKKTYQRHVYPHIVKFASHKRFKKIKSEIPVNKMYPFSSGDEDLLLKKIQKKLNPDQVVEYVLNSNYSKEHLAAGLKGYKNKLDYSEISNHLVRQVKTEFIQFALSRESFSL